MSLLRIALRMTQLPDNERVVLPGRRDEPQRTQRLTEGVNSSAELSSVFLLVLCGQFSTEAALAMLRSITRMVSSGQQWRAASAGRAPECVGDPPRALLDGFLAPARGQCLVRGVVATATVTSLGPPGCTFLAMKEGHGSHRDRLNAARGPPELRRGGLGTGVQVFNAGPWRLDLEGWS